MWEDPLSFPSVPQVGEMDDGEIDFSAGDTVDDLFAECSSFYTAANAGPGADSSFLDEVLMNSQSCTHTHTCNPPGPDNTHTHTCFHTHTQVFAIPDKAASAQEGNITSKKRPLGNKEAVRKYREKKKAHTAFLEEQVHQLRALNQQLLRRLQGQAALEADVIRLRGLLSEFRGRIDGELGLPAPLPQSEVTRDQQRLSTLQPLRGGLLLNSVDMSCNEVPCLHADTAGPTTPQDPLQGRSCEMAINTCLGHHCKKARRKKANKAVTEKAILPG